jgi:hypothetical protein
MNIIYHKWKQGIHFINFKLLCGFIIGKKKKKKEPPPPPPVGPWIHKLHINDNGIDGLLYGKEFAPLEFMRGLKKYVWNLSHRKLPYSS